MKGKTIEEVSSDKYQGKTVTLQGWVYRHRGSKNVIFIILRDSSGIIQATVKEDNKCFKDAEKLTIESSVEVTGRIKKDKRAPTGYELEIEKLKIVGLAERFPITKDKSTEFLREVNYKEKIEKLLDHHKNEKLSKLSVGMQIPCQIIRPEKDSPNAFLETKLIEDLLKTTSIKIVHYPYELLCCGSSMLQYDEQIAYQIAKKRINSLLQKGVDAVVLGCGNCSMNYNIHQKEY